MRADELKPGVVGREVFIKGGAVSGRLLGWTSDRRHVYVEVRRVRLGRSVVEQMTAPTFSARLKPAAPPEPAEEAGGAWFTG